MAKGQRETGSTDAQSDPSVVWHEFYRDPSHEIVLVSKDKVHFRISRFALARRR